jgi:hypothetical protein
LQILKLQYVDFPESISDDFFFQLGCFYERNSDIKPNSKKFSQKYTENFENFTALFFLLRKKKSAKIKNICPQCLPKKSALIPIVKNLNRSKNIINTNNEYTIDPQSKIEETRQYYYQTLEVKWEGMHAEWNACSSMGDKCQPWCM